MSSGWFSRIDLRRTYVSANELTGSGRRRRPHTAGVSRPKWEGTAAAQHKNADSGVGAATTLDTAASAVAAAATFPIPQPPRRPTTAPASRPPLPAHPPYPQPTDEKLRTIAEIAVPLRRRPASAKAGSATVGSATTTKVKDTHHVDPFFGNYAFHSIGQYLQLQKKMTFGRYTARVEAQQKSLPPEGVAPPVLPTRKAYLRALEELEDPNAVALQKAMERIQELQKSKLAQRRAPVIPLKARKKQQPM